MGLGGAVPKGDVSLRYLNDARNLPSTSHGDMRGGGGCKGGAMWWFARWNRLFSGAGDTGCPIP